MNNGGPLDWAARRGNGLASGSDYERYATTLAEVMLGQALQLLRTRELWEMVGTLQPGG